MTNKLFMDLKFTNYSLDGKIISLCLRDNTKFDRVLYLENSDLLPEDATGWVVGDTCMSNRILSFGTPTFDTNIEAQLSALAGFSALIEAYLGNYSRVQILTNNPMAWMFFVSIFGDIEDLPNVIDPIPVFLPSVFVTLGLASNTNPEGYISEEAFSPIDYNSLHDTNKIKKAYVKALKLLTQ